VIVERQYKTLNFFLPVVKPKSKSQYETKNYGRIKILIAKGSKMVKYWYKNIEEILTDHAWYEQKAATNAITIITNN
jgi:hypothetical protein